MWLTALILGFAGSFHCMGMCSPLVMAVSSMKTTAVLNRILYNAGRVATYGLMGAVVATIGFALPLNQYQGVMSILLGTTLLFMGLSGQKVNIPGLTVAIQKFTSFIKRKFGHYIQQKNKTSMIILGSLNGLLPCGLTFVALTYCLTLHGPLDGFNFMLLFGAGTLPVMLGLTSLIHLLLKKSKLKLQRVTTTMLIVSGCLLIARVFLIHLPHASSLGEGLKDIVLCR